MISIAFFILCHCVRKPGLLHPTQRISSIDMAEMKVPLGMLRHRSALLNWNNHAVN